MAIFRKLWKVLRDFIGPSPARKSKRRPPVRKKSLPRPPRKSKLRTQKTVVAKRVKPLPAKKNKPVVSRKSARPAAPKIKSTQVKPVAKAAVAPPEVLVGEITHFFSKISVVVVKLTHQSLSVGERIHVKGAMTDFHQPVKSLQIESVDVKVAKKGSLVGLKAVHPARPGDRVFRCK